MFVGKYYWIGVNIDIGTRVPYWGSGAGSRNMNPPISFVVALQFVLIFSMACNMVVDASCMFK